MVAKRGVCPSSRLIRLSPKLWRRATTKPRPRGDVLEVSGNPYVVDIFRELICCPFVLSVERSKGKIVDRVPVVLKSRDGVTCEEWMAKSVRTGMGSTSTDQSLSAIIIVSPIIFVQWTDYSPRIWLLRRLTNREVSLITLSTQTIA